MYIYLVKYDGHIIAAAEDDASANAIINQYIGKTPKTTSIDRNLFEKESIRFIPKIDTYMSEIMIPPCIE